MRGVGLLNRFYMRTYIVEHMLYTKKHIAKCVVYENVVVIHIINMSYLQILDLNGGYRIKLITLREMVNKEEGGQISRRNLKRKFFQDHLFVIECYSPSQQFLRNLQMVKLVQKIYKKENISQQQNFS